MAALDWIFAAVLLASMLIGAWRGLVFEVLSVLGWVAAFFAAQWFAAIRRVHPDLDDRIAAGDLSPAFDWLREHIWSQGSRWTTDELAVRASGETLNPAHFRRHLEARYLGA